MWYSSSRGQFSYFWMNALCHQEYLETFCGLIYTTLGLSLVLTDCKSVNHMFSKYFPVYVSFSLVPIFHFSFIEIEMTGDTLGERRRWQGKTLFPHGGLKENHRNKQSYVNVSTLWIEGHRVLAGGKVSPQAVWWMAWSEKTLQHLTATQRDLQNQGESRGGQSIGRSPWTMTKLRNILQTNQMQHAQRKQPAYWISVDTSQHSSKETTFFPNWWRSFSFSLTPS